MTKINYALIGTLPVAEQFRNTLPELIKSYEARMAAVNENTPRDARLVITSMAMQIEDCAAHFYGLDTKDFFSMDELIDAIRGLDQELEF